MKELTDEEIARMSAEEREARIRAAEEEIASIQSNLKFLQYFPALVSSIVKRAEQGDAGALHLLYTEGGKMVSALNSIGVREPKRVFPYSKNSFCWPATISRKRASKQENDRLMDAIELGEGGYFSTANWHPLAPSTQAAFAILMTGIIAQRKLNLPRLSQETKDVWFETIWTHMLNSGVKPEEIPNLYNLGKSAVGKKSTSRGMPEQTEGMRRDDVRAEIKRQVRNAFEILAHAEWMNSSTTGNAPS